MSSTSRSADEPRDGKPEPADDAEKRKPASPGRYSLSTEGSVEMVAVRVDSTRMPAVRPEDHPPVSKRALPPTPPQAPQPPSTPRKPAAPAAPTPQKVAPNVPSTPATPARANPPKPSIPKPPVPSSKKDLAPPPPSSGVASSKAKEPSPDTKRSETDAHAAPRSSGALPPPSAPSSASSVSDAAKSETTKAASSSTDVSVEAKTDRAEPGEPVDPNSVAAAKADATGESATNESSARESAATSESAAASESTGTSDGAAKAASEATEDPKPTEGEAKEDARPSDGGLAAAEEPSDPVSQAAPASGAPVSEEIASRPSTAPKARPSSLRPPPPPRRDSIPPLEFDEGSIAFAFDALMSDGPAESGRGQFDLTPVRELFAELAANHMRHVRDFMIDVKWGEVTRDWIEICVPPVTTLGRAAERLELPDLGGALDQLRDELVRQAGSGGLSLDAGEKERLLEAYNKLVEILPQAFGLDGDRSQREAVIVQALLLQVPDVRKVTIDKLHAAGLTSLKLLFEAKADEMAAVAGIPHALATKIAERLEAYRLELQTASPQDARAAEREKLTALTKTLREQHDAYEAAANGWAPDAKAKKRDHFRAREEAWLAISVMLARFGEVDRLRGIEKVPFTQRITQLEGYLDEAAEKYRAEP